MTKDSGATNGPVVHGCLKRFFHGRCCLYSIDAVFVLAFPVSVIEPFVISFLVKSLVVDLSAAINSVVPEADDYDQQYEPPILFQPA